MFSSVSLVLPSRLAFEGIAIDTTFDDSPFV